MSTMLGKYAFLKIAAGALLFNELTKSKAVNGNPTQSDLITWWTGQMSLFLAEGNNTQAMHDFFNANGYDATVIWLLNNTDAYINNYPQWAKNERAMAYMDKYKVAAAFLTNYQKTLENQTPVNPYNANKIRFLDYVNNYFRFANLVDSVKYVRTASMYSSIADSLIGKRATIMVNGEPPKEGFEGHVVLRGTFDAAADWIKWGLTAGSGDPAHFDGTAFYGISGADATAIIEAYFKGIGLGDSLGRGGPTCAVLCSIWNSIDLAKIPQVIAAAAPVIAAFVAGGPVAALLVLPASDALLNALK